MYARAMGYCLRREPQRRFDAECNNNKVRMVMGGAENRRHF